MNENRSECAALVVVRERAASSAWAACGRKLRAAAVVLFGLASLANAQLGAPVAGPYDVETSAGNSGLFSVTYTAGTYWVGGAAVTMGGADKIYEYSLIGTLRRQYDSCPATPLNAGFEGYTGYEFLGNTACVAKTKDGNVCVYCKDTGYVCVIVSSAAFPSDTVACDMATGHLYAASGMSPITEFTMDQTTGAITVLNTLPPSGKVVRGLTWDPVDNTLWAFCANNPNGGMFNLVEFNEINATTGALTGRQFQGNTSLPGPNLAGGCNIYHDSRNPGVLSIVALHRSNPDVLMVYSLGVPAPCTGYPDVYCTAKTNSLGCVPTIGWSGTPSASAGGGFTVTSSNTLNNKNGLLFYGLVDRAGTPFLGGVMCVQTPVRRTPLRASGGTPGMQNDCSGVFSIDMNAFAVGAIGGSPDAALTVPGSVVRCEWWSRDPASPPSNANLSDALEYVLCP